MSLSVATDNLPHGIQFRTEPEQIQPHSKAELILVSFLRYVKIMVKKALL